MKRTEKVILRHNELKKIIKEHNFNDKKKLYKFYVSIVDENENITLVDYQTICNDLNYLQVEPDPDTNILSLPSQIQINNYKKILGHTLKSNNFRISFPIELLSGNNKLNNHETNQNNNNSDKKISSNSDNIELHTLYKIIIFHNDNSTDIINSLIYKCFSNINSLGSTIGFKCLELYFENLETANDFAYEIKKIVSTKSSKNKSKK